MLARTIEFGFSQAGFGILTHFLQQATKPVRQNLAIYKSAHEISGLKG